MLNIQEENLTKAYYSIGEVAEMFEVNTSLIRFWANEFPSIRLRKNKKGNRMFSPRNIMQYVEIYTLVKVKGFKLDGAKKAIKLAKQSGESPIPAGEHDTVIAKLELIKQQLLSLR